MIEAFFALQLIVLLASGRVSSQTCNGIQDCRPGQMCACQHNGYCIAPDYTSCECDLSSGYTGEYCQIPICHGSGCGPGKCIAPNTCDCSDTGFTGPDCSTPICNPTCANGKCVGPNSCDCSNTGYTGRECEIPLCDPGCQHSGNCTEPNVCDCSTAIPGWNGTLCQNPICIEECVHGNCSGPNVCNCENTGYTGTTCSEDVNECQAAISPCDPITICINYPGGYNCTSCPSGYNGSGRIDQGGCIPICSPPCQNGGVCSAPQTCNCAETGYNGNTCAQEIDECLLSGACDPLTNCTNVPGGYQCSECPAGYDGNGKTGCIAICNPACENGGTCQIVKGEHVCVCLEGYSGDTCSTMISVATILNYTFLVQSFFIALSSFI